MNKEKQIVKYSDLSNPIKIAVVVSYIVGILYILAFLFGFMIGLMEV